MEVKALLSLSQCIYYKHNNNYNEHVYISASITLQQHCHKDITDQQTQITCKRIGD